jgi:phospholipase C
VPDARFPASLLNGPFQITHHVGYGAHTGDPTHRFFQMWQQVNGGKNDLFVWVGDQTGPGPSNPFPLAPGRTGQGGVAMGFYNMARGDAALFKRLADQYAIADNYHQPIMGGTTANYFALATADVGVYLEDGKPAMPPAKLIENPDAQRAPTTGTRRRLPWRHLCGLCRRQPARCGRYPPAVALPYRPSMTATRTGPLLHGQQPDPAYGRWGRRWNWGRTNSCCRQTMPHIGDALTAGGVSWKWYSGGRNDGMWTRNTRHVRYADLLQPTMPAGQAAGRSDAVLCGCERCRHFPAVSIIAPYDSISGHPGYAMETSFDELVAGVIDRVSQSALWKNTAILITFDEGGGYYDSGYVQAMDFFGDARASR